MSDDPYAHAPKLPHGADIDPRGLFLPPAPRLGGPVSAQAGAAPAPLPLPDDPVELEIGPGRGWFMFERLELAPQVRIVGLEIRRKWASVVDARLTKRGLGDRGRVFAEDVKLALPRFQARSISIAYLHFPDPWWKKRHAKRLVLSDQLLDELSRVIVPGGELLIQTDVFDRAAEYESRVAACRGFEPFDEQARIFDHPYGARSPRERKAIENGLPVARLRYRCRGLPTPAHGTDFPPQGMHF